MLDVDNANSFIKLNIYLHLFIAVVEAYDHIITELKYTLSLIRPLNGQKQNNIAKILLFGS